MNHRIIKAYIEMTKSQQPAQPVPTPAPKQSKTALIRVAKKYKQPDNEKPL